jgi:hypothetical protein
MFGGDVDFTALTTTASRMAKTSQEEDGALSDVDLGTINLMKSLEFRKRLSNISFDVAPHLLSAYDNMASGSYAKDVPDLSRFLASELNNIMNIDLEAKKSLAFKHGMVFALALASRGGKSLALNPLAPMLSPYLDPAVVPVVQRMAGEAGIQAASRLVAKAIPEMDKEIGSALRGGMDLAEKQKIAQQFDQWMQTGVSAANAEGLHAVGSLRLDGGRATSVLAEVSKLVVSSLRKYALPSRIWVVPSPETSWAEVAKDIIMLLFIQRMNVASKMRGEYRTKTSRLDAIFPAWKKIPAFRSELQNDFEMGWGMSPAYAGKILQILYPKIQQKLKRLIEVMGGKQNLPDDSYLKNIDTVNLANPSAVERVTGKNLLGSHLYAQQLIRKVAESKADPSYVADALLQRIEGWAAYSGGRDDKTMPFKQEPAVPGAEPWDKAGDDGLKPGQIPPRAMLERIRRESKDFQSWVHPDTVVLASAVLYDLYRIFARASD